MSNLQTTGSQGPAQFPALLTPALPQTPQDEKAAPTRRQTITYRVSTHTPQEIIGTSSVTGELREQIAEAAEVNWGLLITGETGTGKRLTAEAVHRQSARRAGPFVKVNCAAIADGVFESEMFGHVRGAFTGADRDKPGYFEEADGGTIFLDEIGAMSYAAQAKILLAIEEQRVTRVGATKSKAVDVRVIAATSADLEGMVAAGTFRPDLLHRINRLHVRVAPLRERPEDVPAIAEHFAREAAADKHAGHVSFTPEASAALAGHAWPGNVRELENAVCRMVSRTLRQGGHAVTLDCALQFLAPAGASHAAPVQPASRPELQIGEGDTLADAVGRYELAVIDATLSACGGSYKAAAGRLQADRNQLSVKHARLRAKFGARPLAMSVSVAI